MRNLFILITLSLLPFLGYSQALDTIGGRLIHLADSLVPATDTIYYEAIYVHPRNAYTAADIQVGDKVVDCSCNVFTITQILSVTANVIYMKVYPDDVAVNSIADCTAALTRAGPTGLYYYAGVPDQFIDCIQNYNAENTANGIFSAANNAKTVMVDSILVADTIRFVGTDTASIIVESMGSSAIVGISTDSYGGQFISTNHHGFYAESTGLYGGFIKRYAPNSDMQGILLLSREDSNSSAGAGMGGSILWTMETTGGSATAGYLGIEWTNPSITERDARMVFAVSDSTSIYERMFLEADGRLWLGGYINSLRNNADSSVNLLAVDLSGDVHTIAKTTIKNGIFDSANNGATSGVSLVNLGSNLEWTGNYGRYHTGTLASVPMFQVTNSGSNGTAIWGTAINVSGGTGVYGTGTTRGVYGGSANIPVLASNTAATSNTSETGIKLERATGGLAGHPGMGISLDFWLRDGGATADTAAVMDVVLQDSSRTSIDADIIFYTVENDLLTEAARLTYDNQFVADGYVVEDSILAATDTIDLRGTYRAMIILDMTSSPDTVGVVLQNPAQGGFYVVTVKDFSGTRTINWGSDIVDYNGISLGYVTYGQPFAKSFQYTATEGFLADNSNDPMNWQEYDSLTTTTFVMDVEYRQNVTQVWDLTTPASLTVSSVINALPGSVVHYIGEDVPGGGINVTFPANHYYMNGTSVGTIAFPAGGTNLACTFIRRPDGTEVWKCE